MLGFVFVTVPPPHGEKYAFSVPISGIYSMLVYPVRLPLYPTPLPKLIILVAQSSTLVRLGDSQVSAVRPARSWAFAHLWQSHGWHFPSHPLLP